MTRAILLDTKGKELRWKDISLCQYFDPELWDSRYEANTRLAKQTDNICLSCPVQSICLEEGIDNEEWGVWGGVYLVRGKIDKSKNLHKTKDIWALLGYNIS